MLRAVYETLLGAYGGQHWWPADDPFEVAMGAVLVQNTAWRNVERAIDRLGERGLLTASAVRETDAAELADILRPSGYYNIKTRRLQALATAWDDAGGVPALSILGTAELRRLLLGIHGIGRETADDILLYAFERPICVVDAYTRRILARLELASGREPYDDLREWLETELGTSVRDYNEFHALMVRLGNSICRPTPRCTECPLRPDCPGRIA